MKLVDVLMYLTKRVYVKFKVRVLGRYYCETTPSDRYLPSAVFLRFFDRLVKIRITRTQETVTPRAINT